jgi:hypothetical protein
VPKQALMVSQLVRGDHSKIADAFQAAAQETGPRTVGCRGGALQGALRDAGADNPDDAGRLVVDDPAEVAFENHFRPSVSEPEAVGPRGCGPGPRGRAEARVLRCKALLADHSWPCSWPSSSTVAPARARMDRRAPCDLSRGLAAHACPRGILPGGSLRWRRPRSTTPRSPPGRHRLEIGCAEHVAQDTRRAVAGPGPWGHSRSARPVASSLAPVPRPIGTLDLSCPSSRPPAPDEQQDRRAAQRPGAHVLDVPPTTAPRDLGVFSGRVVSRSCRRLPAALGICPNIV